MISEIAHIYREKFFPKLSHIRGATRLKDVLEELAVRKISSRNQDHFEFKVKGQKLKIADYKDLKYFVMEKDFVNSFTDSIDSSSFVCDVGSYHGFYSVLGSLGEEVYAFEMSSENVEKVRKNFSLNRLDPEKAINKPVWSEEKEIKGQSEDSSINRVGEGFQKFEAITLDSYFEDKQTPNIFKIDVEGAEYQVLKGMENILATNKPKIFIEIHSEEMLMGNNVSKEDVTDILTRNGYTEIFSQVRGDEELKIYE